MLDYPGTTTRSPSNSPSTVPYFHTTTHHTCYKGGKSLCLSTDVGPVVSNSRGWCYIKYYVKGEPVTEAAGTKNKAEARHLLQARVGQLAEGRFIGPPYKLPRLSVCLPPQRATVGRMSLGMETRVPRGRRTEDLSCLQADSSKKPGSGWSPRTGRYDDYGS